MSSSIVMQEESEEADRLLVSSCMHSPRAREALVRRLQPRVAKLARAFLRNDADAEDATQATLLDILRAIGTFRGESRLETWADKIAVRNAIRLARTRRLASVRNPGVDPDLLAGAWPAPMACEELPSELTNYLDALPEARRTVLVLRHVLGYSVQEIAELSGVSANTVKDRLLMARQEMRRMVRRELAVGSMQPTRELP